MAMQGASTAMSRNQMKAANIPSKVSVGNGHPSTVKASTAPTSNAPKSGSMVKGFTSGGMLGTKIKV